MSLTLVVTRDVQQRYRGFLGSVMLEIAPGVYLSPRMSRRVRENVWDVVSGWHGQLGQGSLTLIWRAKDQPGQIGLLQCGEAPKTLCEADGLLLACRQTKP